MCAKTFVKELKNIVFIFSVLYLYGRFVVSYLTNYAQILRTIYTLKKNIYKSVVAFCDG